MAETKPVHISTLIEALQAAHLSYKVVSKFKERGGIMMVKPPGHFGTSMLDMVSREFHNFLLVSDINTNNLKAMHESLFSGRYRTIAFKDMIKLYERNASSAANLEGTLRSMVDEGWTGMTAEDSRIASAPVRIMVMGAMTLPIYQRRLPDWVATGFARRFIWVHYKLDKPEVVGDAIEAQERIQIDYETVGSNSTNEIKWNLEPTETAKIRLLLKKQPGMDGTPLNLLLKMAVVLKWKYSKMKNPQRDHMTVIREFGRLLQHEYAEVEI